MRTRAILFLTISCAAIPMAPTLARDEPAQQQPEDLDDRLDEARIHVELLEMEVAAVKRQYQKMLDLLAEAHLQRGDQPEQRQAEIERFTSMLHEVRAGFVTKSKELSRTRRRMAELESQAGRLGAAKSKNTVTTVRAIERIIDEILREIED